MTAASCTVLDSDVWTPPPCEAGRGGHLSQARASRATPLPNPLWPRKLITKKMLGANRRNLAIELRDSPNPSTIGQLSGHASDELCVRPAHVRREMEHCAIFYHDQHSIPITHL